MLLLLGLSSSHPTSQDWHHAQVPLSSHLYQQGPHSQYGASTTHGAVASESHICSSIGVSLLRSGGNAVDAMIGTTLCVGVIGMYHSGIGGGGFMLVREPSGIYHSIDFRETAPAAASEDMYYGNIPGSIEGGLSVGVPGEIRGFEYIHSRWGKLPWRDIFAPAVEIARDGFEVGEDLVRYMEYAVAGREGNFLLNDPNWAQDFAPTGRLVRRGEMMTRKRYAKTLENIGELGPDSFYKGYLAEGMVQTARAANGSITLEDLRNYKVVVKPALNITYRGLNLFATASPSSGAVTLSTLKTMEQYDLSDWSTHPALSIHRFNEAMRFGYGARAELGDPDFVPLVGDLEAEMLDETGAQWRRSQILDSKTQPVSHYMRPCHPPYSLPSSHGTSHIVATDHSGLTLTLTTTINLLFGARIMNPSSGIILNDEMNDFSIPHISNEFGFPPSPANFIRPGKRPLSSITPIIASFPNGTLFFATGAAGGSRIVSSTTQVAWHIVEHGDTLTEALRRPRLHDQLIPDMTSVEYKFNNDTVCELKKRGHNVVWVREGYSAVQAVGWLPGATSQSGDDGDGKERGAFIAVGEPRQKDSGGLIC
ncbi:hypothetical protein MKZ38_008446 [Zalerion maritima]|uniref:Glutathione hydrolase n=1 Tax=Zalerion maritima TaxID=339359 RepID=A0AAD5WP36_9PEZI|nr:hypothetical protein MKZ38_008446 [Zalerion maritima]